MEWITNSERAQWNEQGYLHLRGALSPDEATKCLDGLLALRESFLRRDTQAQDAFRGLVGNDQDLDVTQLVSQTPATDLLFDHPKTFGKIIALMGPYIQIAGTEALYRYPSDRELLGVHTDGGPAMARIYPSPGSRVIQLKVQFFLTDVSEPDRGNMVVVPGTHDGPWSLTAARSTPPMQILARAGDALLFPWSLWHGVAPNRTRVTRVSTILRYSQLWCRPVDYDRLPTDVLARLTSRQGRLFGALKTRPNDNAFRPTDHEHLDLVLGPELAECDACVEDYEAERFFHTLYKR
jgi:hypothetical protein